MPILAIDDLDAPALAEYRDLKKTNATRSKQIFIAEGEKLVERLLASRYPVESIVTDERFVEKLPAAVIATTPIYLIARQRIERLIGFNFHRGVLACARRLPARSLAELCPSTRPLTLVVCAAIHDPENLGSILRSSAALGVDGVLLAGSSADPLSRRVLRVSMGAALSLPIAIAADGHAAIAALRREFDVSCWATTLDPAAAPLGRLARPSRLAILFGNEGHGLDAEWGRLCDAAVTIPMRPGVDSLNVAVAAGVFLYQLLESTAGFGGAGSGAAPLNCP
jgi:tRNA G18 (ribose-2'-O)-methylase SpoU